MMFRRWLAGVAVAGSLFVALSAGAQQADPVIEAFQADPEVMVQTQALLDRGLVEGPASRTLVGMQCGVSGCDQRILVAQNFSTQFANTRTTSLFGVVDVDAFGVVRRVTLVELSTPFEL